MVKCEIEFVPFYCRQPLFGDVDAFLREKGFTLFDLRRSRYRRAKFPAQALTRGQLLCGDAWYLLDYRRLAAVEHKQPLFTLCLLAAQLQFHDYALEILDFLLDEFTLLTSDERRTLSLARAQYLRDLSRGALWSRLLLGAESIGLGRPIKLLGRLSTQLGDRLRKDREMLEANWED